MAKKKLEGFLYGLYNSRGGTMFVVSNSRKDADVRIQKELEMTEEDHCTPEAMEAGFDIKPATLYVPEIEYTKGDLEYTFGLEVRADVEHPMERKVSHVTAEAVRSGEKTEHIAGTYHPKWDDDAFSFVVYE